MLRVTWMLQNELPIVEVYLREPITGFSFVRMLLADTGAGPRHSPFELVLSELDCRRFGTRQPATVGIGGAIPGWFPLYSLDVEIPALSVVRRVFAVAVPTAQLPSGLDGIAAFRFLNSFTYGNSGDANLFGLEVP